VLPAAGGDGRQMRRAATSVRLRRGGGVGEQLRSLAAAHSGGERDGEPGRVDLRGRRRWMGLFFSFFKEIVQQNFFYGTYFLHFFISWMQ